MADPPEGNSDNGKRIKSRWYWTCRPGRALSATVVPLGVTRKGLAVSGDRRPKLRVSFKVKLKVKLRIRASIKKNGRRRSVPESERQSKSEPDEDGKA
jgi:hypothetical protein